MARKSAQGAAETGDLFAPNGPRLFTEPEPRQRPTTSPPGADSSETPNARPGAGPNNGPGAGPNTSPGAGRIDDSDAGIARSTRVAVDRPFREFEYNGGVHLVDSVLWCDSDRRHDLTFISHAHFDKIGKNRRILATGTTIKILTRASGKVDTLMSPYRQRFALGQLELALYPAGHMLGSSQLLVQRDGRRIVYASDVNPRKTATAEEAEVVPCDVLAISATYGIPAYRFPPREEVLSKIKAFIDDCLEERANPVLIANQMGTAQELMHYLGHAGYRVRVHRSIHDVAKIYRESGVDLPASRIFQGSPARDEIVIFPPILRKHASIRKLKKFKTALVTGHAVEEDFPFRHRVDAAFPLSDTADHDELVAFIRRTGAKEVYLTGGHAAELTEELREETFRVYPIVAPEQLSLF